MPAFRSARGLDSVLRVPWAVARQSATESASDRGISVAQAVTNEMSCLYPTHSLTIMRRTINAHAESSREKRGHPSLVTELQGHFLPWNRMEIAQSIRCSLALDTIIIVVFPCFGFSLVISFTPLSPGYCFIHCSAHLEPLKLKHGRFCFHQFRAQSFITSFG